MTFTVAKKPSWLIDLPTGIFDNTNYQRIVDFFLIHSPVEGMSARGKALVDYGWSEPWKKPYYLNKQLKHLSTNEELLFSASVYEHKFEKGKIVETMDDALGKADLKTFPQYDKEKICILNSRKNQIISTFAHIRNSLAHCRYNIVDIGGKKVYCFEDVEPRADSTGNVKVSARIILFESTLVNWIDLIAGGEKIYVKK